MRTLLIAAGIAAAVAIPAHAQTTAAQAQPAPAQAQTSPTRAQTAELEANRNRSTASSFTNNTSTNNANSASGLNATTASPSTPATSSTIPNGNAVQVDNVSGNPLGPTTQTESAFRPGGPFSNDSGNRALGTSAGQSSSGTAPGNSSSGIGADGFPVTTNPDGTINPNTNPVIAGTGSQVPEGNVSITNTLATTSNAPQARPATPLFDQAAREGRAKEQARRARGDEPRVYGIAPNTDRDLTHQMPDDPIIRY